MMRMYVFNQMLKYDINPELGSRDMLAFQTQGGYSHSMVAGGLLEMS